jgi:hypothetical protein
MGDVRQTARISTGRAPLMVSFPGVVRNAGQGRFKSVPLESDEHFYGVAPYVESTALRAGLGQRAYPTR